MKTSHLSTLGTSEMSDRVRAFDWSATSLGPIEDWPQSLITAVNLCLNSRFPMFVWWGEDLINIYNDAYSVMLGKRHPAALGQPAREVWAEIWHEIGPQTERVLKTGRATWNERVHLLMERNNYPEDTWFTWSYSPIITEDGNVGGVFNACTEDTAHVYAERERDALSAQQSAAQARNNFLIRVDDAVRPLADPEEITFRTATLLGEYLNADRCAYAEIDMDHGLIRTTGNYLRNADIPDTVGVVRIADVRKHLLDQFEDGLPYILNDTQNAEPPLPNRDLYKKAKVGALICVPIHKDGHFSALMAVHSVKPREWQPDEVELVRAIANRCWESIERARVAKDFRESEQRFRALVTASSDLVYCTTPDWSEMRTLEGRASVAGSSDDDTDWMRKYIHPDDRAILESTITEAITTKSIFKLEHRIQRNDGSVGWVWSRAVPIFDREGNIHEWFGAASDITARRLAEENLRSSEAALKEADRRKDEFLALLAHELRNPLAPIANALSLMRMAPDAQTTETAKDIIDRQIHQLVRLVDDLMDVSRINRGKVTLQKSRSLLSDIVRNAVETAEPLAQQKNQQIRTIIDQDIWLHADAARLSQVFANIINNASKYTQEGGHIEVETVRKPGAVIVCIRDNGIGIPQEKLDHIFELFWQMDSSLERTYSGLGIGLTLVKNLVELHGGTVKAESGGAGKGTSFTVTLPTTESENTQDKIPVRIITDNKAGKLQVFLVDDNLEAAKTMAMMLKALSHEVHVAHDGPSALETIRKIRPDIVFLDIGMPGMDGYKVCRKMKQMPELADTMFVAQTGWGEEEHRKRSAEAGFDLHLVKPVRIRELQQVLDSKTN